MLIKTREKLCRGSQSKEFPRGDVSLHLAPDFAAGGTEVQPVEAPVPVTTDLVSGLYLHISFR